MAMQASIGFGYRLIGLPTPQPECRIPGPATIRFSMRLSRCRRRRSFWRDSRGTSSFLTGARKLLADVSRRRPTRISTESRGSASAGTIEGQFYCCNRLDRTHFD